MNNQRQELQQSFAILNSLLFGVFILYWIDILNSPLLFRSFFGLVLLITSVLKIYGLSAMSAGILEIMSGEEIVFRWQRVHENAMKLWPGFLAAFLLIRLVDFVLFVLFPSSMAFRAVYFSLLELGAAYVLAQWTINRKYVKPLSIAGRKFKFNLKFLMVMFGAVLAELVLVDLFNYIQIGYFQWRSTSPFILNYIHVFEFIFCATCILENYPEIKAHYNSSKEVFLINPMGAEVVQSLGFWFVRRYPPFFVVLKALTPKTYKFREFNQVLWHERYYKKGVLVCITCFTSNSYEAYKIAKEFKKRGSKVVLGGPHVTYLPSEALAFCDSVVIGQAEGVWRELIQDYENGTLKPQYKGTATEDDHHQVHEELLNSSPDIVKGFLQTTHGCKFRCHFCTIPALFGKQVYLQPVNAIVELMKKVMPHYHMVRFIDNNIYSDPGYARELFMALKPLKVKWQASSTIDIAKNQETLTLARESGCERLTFGYEVSGSSLEKNQGGKFAMAQKYLEYTNITKKAGIKVKGAFIFGFDSDNYSTLFALWKFCFSIMPKTTILSILTPLPGSVVWQEMLAQDRIINMNWRSYTFTRMVVRHPHMDHKVMSFFFPVIQTFFLLTTSSGGLMLLVFCYAIPLWIASMTFKW